MLQKENPFLNYHNYTKDALQLCVRRRIGLPLPKSRQFAQENLNPRLRKSRTKKLWRFLLGMLSIYIRKDCPKFEMFMRLLSMGCVLKARMIKQMRVVGKEVLQEKA